MSDDQRPQDALRPEHAFVLQFGPAVQVDASQMEGRVEHLVSRHATRFQSLVDVTAITGVQAADVGAVYQLADGGENVEVLAPRGTDGSLLQLWWKPSRDWQSR